jgi:hypothetical protein
LAADRRGDAVALFMKYVGMPADQIGGMRHAPIWPMFEALAPTLVYDHTAILGIDALVPTERAAHVLVPTLVMNGGASFAFMSDTAQALGKAIPNAQVRTLKGQSYDVSPEVLAPVLVEFFSDSRSMTLESQRKAIKSAEIVTQLAGRNLLMAQSGDLLLFR